MSTLAASERLSRAREWTRLIIITGSAQAVVQVIGFACGILVIRMLSIDQYALYALANAMLGMMTVLADGGVAAGVMSQGGQAWQDSKRLGVVLATGLSLRRRFAVFGVLIAAPLLLFLLRHHGASWPTALLLVAALMPAFISGLSSSILEIASRLHQDIAALQRIQVSSNALRLALSAVGLIALPTAAVAVLASGVAQIAANLQMRRRSECFADRTQPDDPEARREILAIVRRVLPGAIYFAFSGQITIWLVSVFGSTESVAQVGALTRLAQALSLISVLFATLVVPRFSRLPDDKPILARRFVQSVSLQCVVCFGVTLIVAATPAPLLYLLGPEYSGLRHELLLMTVGSCLSLLAGGTYALSVSRGWVAPPAYAIPFSIATQVLAIMYFNMGEAAGVLCVGIAVALSQFLLHLTYAARRIAF